MIQFIPLLLKNWKLLLAGSVIAAAGYGGYTYADSKWKVKFSEMELRAKNAELALANKETQGEKITIQTVIKYIDRVKIVKQKGEDVVKEIPIYITKVADASCPITDGAKWVHDAAATNPTGKVPEAPRNPDAVAQGLKLSTYSETVVRNYAQYYELAEQLRSLQEWVREQERLWNNNKE